ncbi:dephospho-CoA kinase [Winogradskyella aurantiaca]|uniref:dephospho-CoA kinase n=1 Tax=Winogradskyella aurantiaca TaxID=2219558 RepID=UPI000E1D7E2D|nr:dephospho-CoA kinase [Winogradskyella aurantiaca]
MTIVGITGGIGSGKTTVSEMFKKLGVPIYNADDEAKKLMLKEPIKSQLISLFGDQVYTKGQLNRALIRSAIFNNDEIRHKVNNIVHPQVGHHFKSWLENQDSPYILKEAAIIFEEGLTQQYDFIITVVADKEKRIKRVLTRPGITRQMVQDVMDKQWSDDKKISQSDFVITNDSLVETEKKVNEIHLKLLKTLGA